MPERRPRPFILYPSLPGLLSLSLPLILFHPGLNSSRIPAIIIGMGLPALALFSLALLLLALPALLRSAGTLPHQLTLPAAGRIGEELTLESDPPRPAFLPGVRLFLCWSFRFGPFRQRAYIPLPPTGKGVLKMTLSRRGIWEGQPYYLASDPFGLFAIRFPLPISRRIIIPPEATDFSARLPQGKSAQAAHTAPRINEHAEEHLERRPYIPGDDPRRLDWKHYARLGELLVRVGEDALPNRGRIWLLAVCSLDTIHKYFPRRQYRQLDSTLSLTRAAAQTLNDTEVLCLLPGESTWQNTSTENWLARLSATHPAPAAPLSGPGPGDSLVIIAPPSDTGGAYLASEARALGCQVTYLHPPHRRRGTP
ncbi:MAG: hypothetical protein B0D92_07935 [Spirochaeta sp. LUC14_002_19_P3]|nr:MAG: hypothetical protein B0D92_07935 [Spirochaeta sp. LUC14_002_19_P3]